MAMTSFETVATINISQNAVSSPVNSPAAAKEVENSVEVVEDSVENITGALQGGPVPSPQPLQPNEEDDLYSLSPPGQAAQEKQRAERQRFNVTDDNLANPPEDSNEAVDSNVQQRGGVATTALNHVDALLANGATVREPAQRNRKQSLNRLQDKATDSKCYCGVSREVC